MKTIFVILGKIFRIMFALFGALLSVFVLALMELIFFMKHIHPAFLSLHTLLCLCWLIGFFWPSIFTPLARGKATRWWSFNVFGLPALVLTVLFFSLTLFSLYDLDEILLLLAVAIVFVALIALFWPKQILKGNRSKRWMGMAFLACSLVLFILFLIARPLLDAQWLSKQQAAFSERERLLSTLSIQQPVQDGQVKVYPLHVGDTIVTYGQFYGGLNGWEGLGGYFQTLVNKDFITVPIYAYLIDHPKHGLMMVDAGICREQAHEHDHYYSENVLSRLLSDREEYILPPEQDLVVQIRRLGYQPSDIKTVFMTHVHDDHAGGLRELPEAKVVIGKADWEEGVLYAPSFQTVQDHLELITYQSGPFEQFQRSQDYFRDQSVVLLPTPGHSPGHTMVLLQMEGYRMLFVGDHMYTLRHLAVNEVRQMTIGGEETIRQVQGIEAVQALKKHRPETILLYAHDHTEYQFSLIEPLLTDGHLSLQERQQIQAYEAKVFTADWKLRAGNTPFFIPARQHQQTGSVGFA